jgi:hypothetical protein
MECKNIHRITNLVSVPSPLGCCVLMGTGLRDSDLDKVFEREEKAGLGLQLPIAQEIKI